MTLIERLNERAHDPERAIDEGQGHKDDRGRPVIFVALPPASEAQIAAAEARLGFRLPALLRQLYRQVGNGGFGPGYGLRGVPTSPEDEGKSVVGLYPGVPRWPQGLLPVCDWGCGITSYLDCLHPEAPVIRLDPNMPKADVAGRVPAAMHFARAAQVGDACWVECASFGEWLEAWVDGAKLFYAAYGGAEEEDGDEEVEDGEDE